MSKSPQPTAVGDVQDKSVAAESPPATTLPVAILWNDIALQPAGDLQRHPRWAEIQNVISAKVTSMASGRRYVAERNVAMGLRLQTVGLHPYEFETSLIEAAYRFANGSEVLSGERNGVLLQVECEGTVGKISVGPGDNNSRELLNVWNAVKGTISDELHILVVEALTTGKDELNGQKWRCFITRKNGGISAAWVDQK
jgi:hypothetical protein